MNIKHISKQIPDDIHKLIEEIVMTAYEYPEDVRKKEIDEIRFNVEREDGDLYIAYNENYDTPIAFCVCQSVGGVAWLYWIGVLEAERGKGVANEFVYNILYLLKKNKNHKVWADTLQSNHAIGKVFNKNKFSLFATVDNFWHNQDYFFWSKDI